MQVVWMVLLGLVCALGHGADETLAQDRSGFVVDGDRGDWGGGGPGEGDEPFDVAPDTNSTIDIIAYAHGVGSFTQDGEDAQLFAFIFRFLEAPFQGPTLTSVELFFDVSADTTLGEEQPPWIGFLPEFAIEIAGRDGGLTREVHRRLADGEWTATEGEDIPEVEVALSGEWLEGAVTWPALGSPGTSTEDEERGYWYLRWAARTSQDGSHDYVPDGTSYPDVPWGPHGGRITTMVRSAGWGRIKDEQLSGEQE